MSVTLTCEECDKEFESKDADRKKCSRCKYKNRKRKKKHREVSEEERIRWHNALQNIGMLLNPETFKRRKKVT